MVASNGFTDGAKNVGEKNGLDLYRLIDAEAHDWQTYVSIPVLCDFRGIQQYRFSIPPILANVNPSEIVLYDANHRELGTIVNLLKTRWNSAQLPQETGDYAGIRLIEGQAKIHHKGEFLDADVFATIRVKSRLFFGQLQLIDIKGFRDEYTGSILTSGFTTDWLDTMKVEREWQQSA